MKREWVKTADGSFTLYVPELDEHYHSIHGAKQEAEHVFIKYGLELIKEKRSLKVIEMGFGTGLNAYLSYEWSKRNHVEMTYYGIEKFPIEGKMIRKCLKEIEVNDHEVLSFFENLDFNRLQSLKDFQLVPIHGTWEEMDFIEEFDIVFYDAFGPRAQNEMWAISNFEKAFKALKQGGIFTTYCAKGQVKRDLKAVGFTVETKPGPPGKREMTVAYKS